MNRVLFPRSCTLACTLLCTLVGATSACGGDSFRFYDVTRITTKECEIQPQDEFCDDEDLPPPVTEVWAVERVGDQVRVFVDEEVWIATPPQEGDDRDRIVADQLEVATRDPGPCTTTSEGFLSVVANDQGIDGEIHAKSRLTGADTCGATPRGSRTVATITGTLAGAP
jgi:hypothetical protein